MSEGRVKPNTCVSTQVWAAKRFGALRSGGVELDATLAAAAARHAAARAPHGRVTIVHGDVLSDAEAVTSLIESATVLVVFLLPEAIGLVEPLVRRHLETDTGNRALFLGSAPTGYAPALSRTLGHATGKGLDAHLLDRTSLPSGTHRGAAALRILHSPEECSEFGGPTATWAPPALPPAPA